MSPVLDDGRRRAIAGLVEEVKGAVRYLRAALDKVGGERAEGVADNAIEARLEKGAAAGPMSFAQVMGMLKLCVKFVVKNARDVPLIRRKTRTTPGVGDLARARAELSRIEAGADRVLGAVSAGGLGFTGPAGAARGGVTRRATSAVPLPVRDGQKPGPPAMLVGT